MNLLLVRHGEIPSNIKKIYAGRSTEGLNENGISQAKYVAKQLKRYKVHSLFSSPVQRAVQTSRIIGEAIGLDLKIENAFREMELGPWESLSEDDVSGLYPNEWKLWQSRPAELKLSERETLEDLLSRVLAGISKLFKNECDRTVVVVTHVAIIRVLLLWHAHESLNLYKKINVLNAEVFQIEIDEYRFSF